jgi:tRNA 2-thiouridine synthesizing protein A
MPLSSPPSLGGEATPAGASTEQIAFDTDWDAGDLACGELVLELRLRMRKLASGQVLRLTALDPGAPADIPAWCRMTGHHLLQANPVTHLYFVQRP